MLLVHIERVNLAEVAVSRLHEVETVSLRLRERELVRQDNALRELLDLNAGDDALDAAAGVVGVELLLVDINRGLILVNEDSLLSPAVKNLARCCVNIVAFFGQLKADNVVFVLREIRFSFLFADNVIGRTAELAEPACAFGVVAHTPERFDFSHKNSPFLIHAYLLVYHILCRRTRRIDEKFIYYIVYYTFREDFH